MHAMPEAFALPLSFRLGLGGFSSERDLLPVQRHCLAAISLLNCGIFQFGSFRRREGRLVIWSDGFCGPHWIRDRRDLCTLSKAMNVGS